MPPKSKRQKKKGEEGAAAAPPADSSYGGGQPIAGAAAARPPQPRPVAPEAGAAPTRLTGVEYAQPSIPQPAGLPVPFAQAAQYSKQKKQTQGTGASAGQVQQPGFYHPVVEAGARAEARPTPIVSARGPSAAQSQLPEIQTQASQMPKQEAAPVAKQQAVQAAGSQGEPATGKSGAKPKGKGGKKGSAGDRAAAAAAATPLETIGTLKAELPAQVAAYKPVVRPDSGGTLGRPIRLRANFFEMRFNPNLDIYHHDIELVPEIRNKIRLREIFTHFAAAQAGGIFRNALPVFDGRKNVYTAKQLPLGGGKTEIEFQVPGERRPFVMKIQLVNRIPLCELQNYLSGKTRESPLTAIQALDIVLREMPSHNHVTLGRFFFTNPTGDSMGAGLELWKGYYQSVRPTRWKIVMLQIDTSVRVFHKGQDILDLVVEYFRLRSKDDLRTARLGERDWEDFESHVRGLVVETTHQPEVKRTYKIIGLSSKSAAEQTFPLSQPDGKETPCRVGKYFMDQYKIQLRFPNLPCLQAQPKEKHRYLPMEFCKVRKGQQLKKLTDDMTTQMIRKSAIPAPDRERRINDLVKGLNINNDKYTNEFGLKVNTEMARIDGRVLIPPSLEYKNKEKVTPSNGSWNMRQAKFYATMPVKSMAVICLDYRTDDRVIQNFVMRLRQAGEQLDMILPVPCGPIERPRGARGASEALHFLHKKHKIDLMLIVMPSQKDNILYGTIKSVGDTELGIVTQCVKSINVSKSDQQTLANICMKINSKLGATNTIIANEMTSKVLNVPTMIMGADVTHPSPGDFTKPSIAAVTASFDQRVTKYAAKISIQRHREEIIQDLANITYELLEHFRKFVKKLPYKIIFYRDGVSEGQFREVLAHELRAVQEACYKFGKDYQPSITFIVVQKRHKTRLFCADSRDSIGKSGNVPAGTTVDTAITSPIEFDFYLCSHHGIQGTSRPAHYHVLYDDNNFTSDNLQELTYHLCHVYARCTRSVSIPAPAYYAHHCAFRGRYYLDVNSNQGQLPLDEKDIPRALANMNQKCRIHELTPGMFFA